MADETPQDNSKNEEELFQALGADMGMGEGTESWVMLNEVYRGLVSGGFTNAEAIAILTSLMWKMILEGGA